MVFYRRPLFSSADNVKLMFCQFMIFYKSHLTAAAILNMVSMHSNFRVVKHEYCCIASHENLVA